MRKLGFIGLMGFLLLFFGMPVNAQEATDSIVSIDSVPEWYVAPEIPLFLRAPKRAAAAAASCTRVEAIQTFNIDSVLTEGTYYEYDAKGNVISTTVWTYNPDGTMTGKSKNEYAFDATGTQTMTAVYIWDGAANDWKGTEKYEYVYKTFAGEKKMTSSTSSVWLNGAWVADQRFTYDYDASLREISYFEYRRNTSTNELQPVKGREQLWTDDLQTLEALYTAYANGKWTAGTKKEWVFDGNGTQTMYATYTISNGAWVGSSKETWAYNTSSKLTLHEKYGWAGNDWSITLQEKTTYDASGNTTLIENYSWSNGIKTGTKKEEYTFDGDKPVLTMVYAWSNGAWIGSSKEVWNYNASSKLTLHEKYGWANNDWSLTLQEKTVYSGANITLIENYTYANGVPTGTKKEEYTFDGSLKTSFVTYSWAGSDWVGASKDIWAYTSGKQTLHETYAWGATDWSITLQENTAYSGANITKIENYTWTNGTKTGTQKEEYAYTGSQKTQEIIYAWANTDWVESSKEIWGYTSGKQTLHETYVWGATDWSITLQENTAYSGANITKIENYTWTNGTKTGTQKEEYTYTSGEKTMTVVYAWANNDWVYSTKNEAGYWDGNVEISATNYAWNGIAWVGTGNRIFTTYDNNNYVIETLRQDWPEGATDWVNGARAVDTYNEDGVNIMTYVTSWNGTAWTLYSMTRTDIIKDAAGRQLLKASWRCGSDSIWVGVQKDTAAYTATNKPLYSASYKSWANGDWVPYTKSEYTYDASDRQTLLMQYEGKNGKWVNKTKVEQRYDMFGNRTLSQSFKWLNNTWVGVYKYEYTYDAAGRQTRQAYYEWSSGRWSGFSCSGTEYDDNGNIIATMSFQWMNNTWQGLLREENVYDEKLRVVEYIRKNWKNNNWANSRRFIYTYDQLDRLVSTRQYRWYNNVWELCEVDDKEYDQSDMKLLNELYILWNNHVIYTYSDKHYFYNCDPHFYTVRFVNYDGKVLENTTVKEGENPTYVGSNPTREGNAEYSYTFSGWNPTLGPVTSNVTYTATFTATKNTYTITWKNEDGTLIDQTTAEYGTMPTHEDASKANTAEYTYTFAGWTPGIGIVTGDATYTATFTATKNQYTITWLDEAGNEIDQTTVEYGIMPTHANPTKENTAEYTYTFTGWTPGLGVVTGEATYKATFNATKNSYTIKFLNYEGTELQSGKVEYGVKPTYDGATPTKPSDDEFHYAFDGWDKKIVEVVGEETYTATFSTTTNEYTITWYNDDNTLIDQTTVVYGVVPTHEDPTKENTAEWTYTFSGWDHEIIAVNGNATYKATYTATKNKYLVVFQDEGGTELQSGEVGYGTTPEFTGAEPSKEATAQYTYSFNGWDPEITAVEGAQTYTATYSSTVNKYTIRFINEDDSELQSSEVEYGTMPTYDGETPHKEADAQYTYTFAGWDKEVVSVTGEATYKATYSSTTNQYTVKFVNYDGEELQSSSWNYGAMPSYSGETPTKPADDENNYTFEGWSPVVTVVTKDATYTATYTKAANEYTITWYNDDNTLIDQTTVAYGVVPTHDDPTKENTAEWTYTFSGWDHDPVAVTGNASYTATYNATKNKYLVVFQDEGGTELQSGEVEYGTTPEFTGAEPSKEATAQYTYAFAGWDPEITAVESAQIYTAKYSSTVNKYTITWLNEDGSELSHETHEYGTTPQHEDLSKENTAEWTYTFTGWTPAIVSVEADASYQATFSATKNSYTITWLNEDGSEIEHETLEYGITPSHADIYKESTEEFTYTFIGWTPSIVPVNGDAAYKAVFEATPVDPSSKTFTITFLHDDGITILEQVTVEYGETPVCRYTPTKMGDAEHYYTFVGWSPEIVPATANASYTPLFELIARQYVITFKNYDGKVLQTTKVDYGAIPAYTGATPTRNGTTQYAYVFTGWTPELAPVTKEATYKATFERTARIYTVIYYDEDGETELDRVEVAYGQMPHTSVVPTKEEDEEYYYVFIGWTPYVTFVTKDASYSALFQKKNKLEGIEDVESEEQAVKIFKNNILYILRAGKIYTVDGKLVEEY